MDLSHISQLFGDLSKNLANLPISSIMVFAVILTAVRLFLTRVPTAGARAGAEFVEAALIAVVLVFMIVQPFIMKTFYIPSGSMRPTLIDDDHIVTNKFEYRVEKPHVEDVVVFVAPQRALEMAPEGGSEDAGPTYYIKRMMGQAGDVIEAHHGYVTVNGKEEGHEDIRSAFNLSDRDNQHVRIEQNDIDIYDGSWTRYSAADIATHFSLPGAIVTFHPGQTFRNGKLLAEPYTAEDPGYDLKLYNGQSVISDPDAGGIRISGAEPTRTEFLKAEAAAPGSVPPGYVFVMGDNRNDSNDSTRWGPLERDRVVGKASFIFFPFSRVRAIN